MGEVYMAETTKYVRWLDQLTNDDVTIVGGKNASLGEMIQSLKNEGVHVPGGFATTSDAYREFLTANGLTSVWHANWTRAAMKTRRNTSSTIWRAGLRPSPLRNIQSRRLCG